MNDYLILPEILKRRSILSFSDRHVEHEKLMILFEAARWAPSSLNLQPWRFIYASKDDPAAYQCIFGLLNEGNRRWAETAPVLVVSVAEMVMEYKSRSNRFAFHDMGMAVGNLLIQAAYLDLYVHPMGGFNSDECKQILKIPERFDPVAIMAIGYKGDPNNLPADLRERELKPRERREVQEFLFQGTWGKTIPKIQQ
jgi:nitroreductase